MAQVDVSELRDKVQAMYKAVAEEPHGRFHFEMGRDLAQRLGYPAGELDRLPPEAVESFAGVGYHLGLAAVTPGERVVDLGSGSGMDLFLAARQAGPGGVIIGVDMTREQLAKARRLATRDGYTTVRLEPGCIEQTPLDDSSADVVISNGVINLCDDKTAVFAEIARILKPGGRTAFSDIVTERPLTEAIVCDVNLWGASCIGGAIAARRLPAHDRRCRAHGAHGAGEPRIPLHLRLGTGCDHDVRREKHLGAGRQAR